MINEYFSPQASYKSIQLQQDDFFGSRFVNGLQVCGHALEVFVRRIAHRVANLANDTFLNIRFRVASRDRLAEARQVVHTDQQDVLNAPVLQVV